MSSFLKYFRAQTGKEMAARSATGDHDAEWLQPADISHTAQSRRSHLQEQISESVIHSTTMK